jgi:hypothetical protein
MAIRIRRRELLAALGGAAVWPVMALARQSDRVRRLGVLISLAEDDPQGQQQAQTLLQSLQELGWKRGTNLEVDLRWGATNNERIQNMARELACDTDRSGDFSALRHLPTDKLAVLGLISTKLRELEPADLNQAAYRRGQPLRSISIAFAAVRICIAAVRICIRPKGFR